MILRLAAFLTVLLMAALPVKAAGVPGSHDPSIVIGLITSLSGPGAINGQDAADGVSLALKQFGGRFSNQEVRLVLSDDKGSPDVARKQVLRMIQSDRLDVIITSLPMPALAAIQDVLASSRLFVLHLDTPLPETQGSACHPNMFSLAPPLDAPHALLGQHLNADGARRLVVVGPQTVMTTRALHALKATFPHEVTVLHPRPGAATFDRELTRIGEIQPDAVYSLLTGGTGGAFIRAYDDHSGKALAPLYAVSDTVSRTLLPAMGDASLDVRTVSPWALDQETPLTKRLISDFESEYGRPISERAARGYDAALLLDAVLKSTNGKTGDSEALRQAFRKAEFTSVRGTFHFNHNHQPIMSYYLLRVSRDARARLVHETLSMLSREWRDPNTSGCPMHWAEEYVPPTSKPAKR